MRALLWLIAIFALAAGVAMLASQNEGYVLLVMPPWRAQASLNLIIVALLLGFLTLHLLLRLVSRTLDLPGRVAAYRARRQQQRASESMNLALRALFEGRFGESLKHARTAWSAGGNSPLAALVAARAARALNDERHYRQWIERAGSTDEGRVAGLLTEAELEIDASRFEHAARPLKLLRDAGHESGPALRMALEVAAAGGRWDEAAELVQQLASAHSLPAEELKSLRQRAQLGRLETLVGEPDKQAAVWRGLLKEDLGDPAFVAKVVPLLAAARQGAIARRAVERLLDREWSSELARRYVLCAGEGEEAKDALSRAEAWLAQHPDDAGLLYSLGRLCMQANIWGKARSCLERSLALEPSAQVHYALAELMEKLEQPREAAGHYRAAAKFAAA